MSQYTTGTVTVTSGSETVTGYSTAWSTSGIVAGYAFLVDGDTVPYYVASVDSDTQITLSAPYQGDDGSNLDYYVFTSRTPNLALPYPEPSDAEPFIPIRDALLRLDAGIDVTGVNWRDDVNSGNWSNITAYSADDGVLHNGSSWRALVDTTAGQEPGASANWKLIASKGDTGATGATGATGPQGDPGVNWRDDVNSGDWDAATAYAQHDGVAHNGASWRALAATTAGQEPGVHANWKYIAAKGDTGAQGPQGDTGPQGPQGDTGPVGVNWRDDVNSGSWDSGTAYAENDGVLHNGSSWRANAATVAGQEPGVHASWTLIAQKGTDGAGAGDVLGPATHAGDYIPQWSGANTKTLKEGLAVTTTIADPGVDTKLPTEKAVRDAIAAAGTADGKAKRFFFGGL